MQTSSSTESAVNREPVCPICGGVGWLHQDLPITDPNFGKLVRCVCKQQETAKSEQKRLYQTSNLDAFSGMVFSSFPFRVVWDWETNRFDHFSMP